MQRGAIGAIWLRRALLCTMLLHLSLVAATSDMIYPGRSLQQAFTQTNSMDPADEELQLLAPFETQHSPPDADWKTVTSLQDMIDALDAVEDPDGVTISTFVRLSKSVTAVETTFAPFLRPDTSLTFDCQGAMMYTDPEMSLKNVGEIAQNNTFVDIYHCILYGPPGVQPLAKEIRFNDCRVMFPCGVEAPQEEATGFRQSAGLDLVSAANALVHGQVIHMNDTKWELNGGEVRHMRNVTVQCAEESEILRELEILEPSEDPSTAWSWVIVGLITAAGVGAVCCLVAALCDLRCRPSLSACKAWFTTCGHTKIPVRIVSSPPSPSASIAAAYDSHEPNPKSIASERYQSKSKRSNVSRASFESSAPGDLARTPGVVASRSGNAFDNEAFESDSAVVNSPEGVTPQSGPARSFHMLEPAQMQATNNSTYSRTPLVAPTSVDCDSMAMKQLTTTPLSAKGRPPKPPLNMKTNSRELGSPNASHELSQAGSGALPAPRSAPGSSNGPTTPPAGSALNYASSVETGPNQPQGHQKSPPSSLPPAPRSFVAQAPDSPGLRIFTSVDHPWAHSTTGSVNLATTPTHERPPEAIGFFRKDSGSHPLSSEGGPKDITPPASHGRGGRDASPHRDPAVMGLRASRQLSGPRSQEVGLLSTTSELPKDHLVRHERLSGYGPNICRASWKDIPAMIQELLVAVPCAPGTAVARSAAAITSQGRGGGGGAGGAAPSDMIPSSDSAYTARAGGTGASSHTRASSHGRLPSLLGRTNSNNVLVELTSDSSLVGNTFTEGDMAVTSFSSQHGPPPNAEVQVGTRVVCKGARFATRMAHENIVNTFTFSVQHEETQPSSSQHASGSNKGGTPRHFDDDAPEMLHFTVHLVQELCVGGTLANLMESGTLATQHGGIHARRIITILSHIAAGLAHLHANGLVHGDLDPSHVLLQVVGEEHEAFRSAAGMHGKWLPSPVEACDLLDNAQTVAKLGNFGWAVCEPCSYTPSTPLESVAYWAPERHSGTQNAATHIYSFGCLMWNLWVTQESQVGLGCKPHPQMGHFPASTPLSYVMLATACLSLKPEDRPSASGLLQDLNGLQRELRRHYTDLCGASQSIDRLAFKYDRANLLDPTSSIPLREGTSGSEQHHLMGSR